MAIISNRVGAPESTRSGIASSDPERVRAAVRALTKRMAKASAEDRLAAAELVAPLACHSSPGVRQAVAAACAWFPEPHGTNVLAKLADDPDGFVQNAASDAAKGRKTPVKKTLPRDDPQDVRTKEILSELSPAARQVAKRALWTREDYLIRRLQHEITKVLGVAVTSVDFARLENKKTDGDRESVEANLKDADERLERALKMLSSFQRYAATFQANFCEVDLFDVVDDAKKQLIHGNPGRASRIAFSNEVAPGLVAAIDRANLMRAIENVLQNAVDRRGNTITLCFSDRGPGMTENQRAGLFVPLHSKKLGGTGFGLLTAQRMVEDLHNGSFEIESEPGRGTTVCMTFPKTVESAKRASKRRA
jgi:signal transduction histidine kinase